MTQDWRGEKNALCTLQDSTTTTTWSEKEKSCCRTFHGSDTILCLSTQGITWPNHKAAAVMSLPLPHHHSSQVKRIRTSSHTFDLHLTQIIQVDVQGFGCAVHLAIEHADFLSCLKNRQWDMTCNHLDSDGLSIFILQQELAERLPCFAF